MIRHIRQWIGKQISRKILVPVTLIITVTIIVFGLYISTLIDRQFTDHARFSTDRELDNLSASLSIINTLMMEKTQISMRVLKETASAYGRPSLSGEGMLGTAAVPRLMMGTSAQLNATEIVDQVRTVTGSTATLFVKRGSDYIRVSTNVLKPDGSRAVGTVLDPSGAAIRAINAGSAFYGVVDILGKPYFTGYEPMLDSEGGVIGIWYVGYPISLLKELATAVDSTTILKHGFIAVVDKKHQARFFSHTTTADEASRLAQMDDPRWVILRKPFDSWGYTIVGAYPNEDVAVQIRSANYATILIALAALGLAMWTISLFVRRIILRPLKEIERASHELARGSIETSVEWTSDDELGHVSTAFRAMVDNSRCVAQAAESIAHGRLDMTITPRSEVDLVSISMQHMLTTLNSVMDEIAVLTRAGVDGKLSARGNSEDFEGGYRDIIIEINAVLDAVIKPVEEGTRVLEAIAAGDLTKRVQGMYGGDHETLKNSINYLADSLSALITELRDAISATSSASTEIASSAEQLAAGAQEQTTQAAEIAASVNEMSKTIMDTTRHAATAAETARQAGADAKAGGVVVGETVEGMHRIEEVVRHSADTVKELGRSSEQIGEITQVIDDIADQTNLLALNAAIEAARAGDQGRGFAVVADEVRKLAERTTKATKEIAEMIKRIQTETLTAVQSMERGTDEAAHGKEMARRSGESLALIIAESEKVVDIISHVAAASEEQSSTSNEINKNVETITNVTQDTASATQQIAKAAEDLNRLTQNLNHLVDQFKVASTSLTGRSSVSHVER